MVDTLGLLIAVLFVAANTSDNTGEITVIDDARRIVTNPPSRIVASVGYA